MKKVSFENEELKQFNQTSKIYKNEYKVKKRKQSNSKFILLQKFLFIFCILFIIITSYKIYNKDKLSQARRNIKHIIKNTKNTTRICNKIYNNPDISFIIYIDNISENNNLIYTIKSITENLKKIEIIINELTNDNTINKFLLKDKRIKILEKQKNECKLLSIISAVKNSHGKYILILRQNDLILYKGIKKAFSKGIKLNLDIIESSFIESKDYKNINIGYKHNSSKIYYQPLLSYFMNYENGKITNNYKYAFFSNKLIKKEIILKAIKYIKSEYYINNNINLFTDNILYLSLFRHANNYSFIEDFGTLYYKKKFSLEDSLSNFNNKNEILYESFLYLKYINNWYFKVPFEQELAAYYFIEIIQYITISFDNFYCNLLSDELFNLYTDLKYIYEETKIKINETINKYKTKCKKE